MAVLASAASAWSTRRILLAVLAISVVLNLLFIAGAVWTRMQPSPPRGLNQRFQRIGEELDLDPQQRAAFNRLVAAMRARGEAVQQQVTPLYGAAWQAAGNPAADASEVLRLFDKAFDRRRDLNRETIAQTIEFLATLPPEQRSRFVALARDPRTWRK